jgi:peroxiredoxin
MRRLQGPSSRLLYIAISAVVLFSGTAAFAADPADARNNSLQSAGEFNPRARQGKNLLLFLYSIDDSRVDEAVQVMQKLYAIRHEYNLDLVGISLNPEKLEKVTQYNQNHGISFPVYMDYNKTFSSPLAMKGGIGFYIYNKQGALIASSQGIATTQEASLADSWLGYASKFLRISYFPADEPLLGVKPPVPLFKGKTLEGATVDIKQWYTQKPIILVFFSPGCSHCKDELLFLNTLYTSGELAGKFEIVAVSSVPDKIAADFINKQHYSFPVIVDTDRKIASLFPSYTGTIPLSFIIDRQGFITSQHTGYADYLRDVYVMELKKLAGMPNPPLLITNGYSGEMRCKICHEKEHIQWKLTRHADAFQSLIRKGEQEKAECIACHVTGFGSSGGYDPQNKKQSKRLEGVQCESCHGAGSQSCSAFNKSRVRKKKPAEWKKLCMSCHTEKESINFIFAKRYPRILHSAAPDLSRMSREERLIFLQSYREKRNIFDNPARYVGAAACKECHRAEYSHWEKTAHAQAHETAKAKSAPPVKLFRYNTGVDSPGGYPEAGRAGVQCEACHGPGEKHLANPGAKGHGFIVGLKSECSNCVVEQICRRCHSVGDDPEFDFERSIATVKHKQTGM